MVRDIWNNDFRKEAREFWEYLETQPETIKGYYQLNLECREIARRLIAELDTHKDFIEKLKYHKIPYPIKQHGFWFPFPKTKNLLDKNTRKCMKQGDKHQTRSVKNAIKENTFLPSLEINIQDIKLLERDDTARLIGFENETDKLNTFKTEIKNQKEKKQKSKE